jgi:hypothetical protein
MSSKIVFVDFEASGLFGESWPIEVGYAAASGEEDAFLLSRHADWSLENWDKRAEQVHGICLKDLENGVAPQAALARLETLKDALVVSDAPVFDNFWLGRLAAAAGAPAPFVVTDWEDILPTEQSQVERQALLASARAKEPRLHRAAADARVMRAVWRASWAKAQEGWLQEV